MAQSVNDPSSFEAIFDRHYRWVHRYLGRQLPASVADDLAAETFLIAFRSRASYDLRRPNAGPWLLGIAANLVRRHLRQNQRMWRAYLRELGARQVHNLDVGTEVVNRLDAKRLAERLAEVLLSLRAEDREVLLLYGLGELTYEEISQSLNLPLGTVRSRLARARRRTRELLGDIGQFDSDRPEGDAQGG